MASSVVKWLDDRLDLSTLRDLARGRSVPAHRYSIFYFFGGATLFLLGVQVVTGILLTLYYRPSTNEAYASVQHVITNVPYGDLIRSAHAWAADLLVGFLSCHLFAVWIMAAYRKPRELTWVLGAVLLLLVVGLGFTGYLLPWNERSYFATRVGTEIAGHVPLVGSSLRRFLRGGDEITGLTLSRFYAFHVALLPALITVAVAVHLGLVQRFGVSVPRRLEGKGPVRTIPFFPHGMLRDAMYWLVLLGIVVTLATYLPRALGLPADPFAAPSEGIRPEWYFWFAFFVLKALPARIFGIEGEVVGVTVATLFAVFLLILPFIDKKGRLAFSLLGWITLACFLGFTTYVWLY